ncbi:hypothetical protein NO932_11600 [Pelagibacterium sp. 26DY04]|uniref:DnaT-like ssDNA-binding protein n=1 Tax=Pelagibacterium sp. 26DY04 TaxID=2967130 RepID=UPI002814C391|nr:DnaT-like ssDNA-binding protein [Pelagibacterium sp. 26DY04]WMT85572.1 hypothetical protein NO932_11600 [Pelagibacterium sp. 26DY04]
MAGYGTDQGFTDWLSENGFTLPEGAPSIAVLRERGSSYIDGTYGSRFSGVPTGGFAQERAWPRTGAKAYGQAIGSDVIPDAVIKASYVAAFAEAKAPGSLSVTYTPGTTKVLTKVDKIEWDVIGDASAAGAMIPVLSAVEGLLAPFLVPVGGIPDILVV